MEVVLQRSSAMAFSPTTPPPPPKEEVELRRGPWTMDEDLTLINYIADHGEGRWNSLARAAGLKRTGKSCRLRWLNYLRPDVKRGNFTAEEQLLILELHSRWGNRWSKIAQHLPGRTDNEIKNYWRTRVQKHAKQLNCDVNSKKFKDAMRYLWMPRLMERARAASGDACATPDVSGVSGLATAYLENSSVLSTSSDSLGTQLSSPLAAESYGEYYSAGAMQPGGEIMHNNTCESSWPAPLERNQGFWSESVAQNNQLGFQELELSGWVEGFSDGPAENLWSLEDIWKMQ